MKLNNLRIAFRLSLVAVALLLVCGMAAAQNDQVKGVINGRSGATLSVLSQGGQSITVVLTPDTQVLEPEGLFRKKHLTMTALVPGLAVEAKGAFNDKHQLVANQVTFHGGELKTAQDIQAGLAPTEQQVQQNQQQINADQQKLQ
jgi:OmpA-OmpF porin, OOP family